MSTFKCASCKQDAGEIFVTRLSNAYCLDCGEKLAVTEMASIITAFPRDRRKALLNALKEAREPHAEELIGPWWEDGEDAPMSKEFQDAIITLARQEST